MEEYGFLMDVIGSLVENGYSVNFSGLEEMIPDLDQEKELAHNDFKIDGIYACRESLSRNLFVFAVSSVRYKFKGILINAIEEQETPQPFAGRFTAFINKKLRALLRYSEKKVRNT